MRVIGYVRVSTEEQGVSGAGLQAQRAAIIAECERRGWTLVEIAEDVGSGKSLKRPGIRMALDMLAAGDASALVVAKLDRLSRSMLDFAGSIGRARSMRCAWSTSADGSWRDAGTAITRRGSGRCARGLCGCGWRGSRSSAPTGC